MTQHTSWFQHFINFFNSSFFIALVTLVVGSYALYLYFRRQRDRKREAANVILLEITNAERVLRLAKDALFSTTNEHLPDTEFAMKTENWSKYRALFVRDFDRNEWDALTNFYDRCKLYDEAVQYNNSAFAKNEEQLRITMQKVLADYAKECAEELGAEKDLTKRAAIEARYQDKKNEFINIYMNRLQFVHLYNPQKPINDAKAYVNGVDVNLSQSSIGIKLKQLAGLEVLISKRRSRRTKS